jgi:hypothetical protein
MMERARQFISTVSFSMKMHWRVLMRIIPLEFNHVNQISSKGKNA